MLHNQILAKARSLRKTIKPEMNILNLKIFMC